MLIFFLSMAAFVAGFVDSIAGGGGLIQVPALILFGGNLPVATLLGTNKFSSICGTTAAIFRYSRTLKIRWKLMLSAALLAGCFSFFGSKVVPLVSKDIFRPLAVFLLGFVLVFSLTKKHFVKSGVAKRKDVLIALPLIAAIGFYDGFFGPGTGGFLIFVLIHFLRLTFLEASANAKIINWATNFASLIFFMSAGFVKWEWALPMCVCNILGGYAGSHTAIKRGDKFIRPIFIVMVALAFVRLIFFA